MTEVAERTKTEVKTDDESESLLIVNNLKKHFNLSNSNFTKNKRYLRAVDGVDLHVNKGETLGIVGESGCGKSTLGNLIMGLLEPTEGDITFDNQPWNKLPKKVKREKRKDIQMIFQDPFSSLNPRMKVFDIVAEPLRTHRIKSGKALKEEVYHLLEVVGLDPSVASRYPHEFSGGQRQRIGIARAIALKPKLIVCDEPVSALDVSIQAQILNLLNKLQEEFNLTFIFIGHGLPAVKFISDRIAVMYLGKIVELADKDALFDNPLHPYTNALLNSNPISNPKERDTQEKILLKGELPNPENPPSGCPFHPRCPIAQEKCKEIVPKLERLESGHTVACHYPMEKDLVL